MSREVVNLERAVLERVVAHGGAGQILFQRLLAGDAFESPIQFVDLAVVPPGASIGMHRHGRNEELYFVLSGRGRMSRDGEEVDVGPGDIVLNRPGGTHGLVSIGAEPVKLLVIEVALDQDAKREEAEHA